MSDQALEQSQDLMNAMADTPESDEQPDQPEGQAEPEQSGVDPADQAQAETQAQEQKFRVRVKGDAGEDIEQELTLAELQSGYQRQADYTRKTQELAQQREQSRTQAQQAISQELTRQQQELQRLQAVTWQTLAPELQGVDWQKLATEDPAAYVQMQAKAQQFQATMTSIDQRLQQITGAQQAQQQAHMQQELQRNAEALKRDGFDLAKYQQTLKSGLDYGFSQQELHGLTDARVIKVLADAAKYRELQKSGKPLADKKVAEASPVVKPGATSAAGGVAGKKDPEKMSTAEWMKWRNAQAAGRGRR